MIVYTYYNLLIILIMVIIYIWKIYLNWKKSSPFANLLMKKQDNWVGIAKKVRITPEEERDFKKSIGIFT